MPSDSSLPAGCKTVDRPAKTREPDCAAHHAWSWRRRLTSAAGRRLRSWWPRTDEQPQAVEAAIGWLCGQDDGHGLSHRVGGPSCPGVTAAVLPTLFEFGQLRLVHCWSEWLLARQSPDGSFPRPDTAGSSPFNTAQALAALVEPGAGAIVADIRPARRAGDWLAARLASPCKPATGPLFQLRVASELCCLPALAAAARRFDVSDWRQVVERVAARAKRIVDGRLCHASMRLVPYVAEAWLTLGEIELAHDAIRGASALQRRNGAVPADDRKRWGDHATLAHLASLWYRLGDRARADRALAFLVRRQSASGGWSETWGQGRTLAESAWVAKHFLDAVRWQVATSFSAGIPGLPLAISAQDGRLLAVQAWLAGLGQAPKVADVGCGSGRFLRELAKYRPAARLVGIDPSAPLLERLPAEAEPRRGGLLRIPASDGEFDGAFAVESLEHALLPRRAVEELCRVVRPGGRVLIIDKHAARQPLSLHEPWERWFLPETVTEWLAPHCRDIHVRPVAHGPDPQSTGLFLCWEATRVGGGGG